jgi:hypothetical protein
MVLITGRPSVKQQMCICAETKKCKSPPTCLNLFIIDWERMNQILRYFIFILLAGCYNLKQWIVMALAPLSRNLWPHPWGHLHHRLPPLCRLLRLHLLQARGSSRSSPQWVLHSKLCPQDLHLVQACKLHHPHISIWTHMATRDISNNLYVLLECFIIHKGLQFLSCQARYAVKVYYLCCMVFRSTVTWYSFHNVNFTSLILPKPMESTPLL